MDETGTLEGKTDENERKISPALKSRERGLELVMSAGCNLFISKDISDLLVTFGIKALASYLCNKKGYDYVKGFE